MRRKLDAIEDSIPHGWVVAPEVSFHTKHRFALLVLSGPHLFKLGKVLLHSRLSPGTVGASRHLFEVIDVRLSDDVSARLDLILGLMADICIPLTDQLESELVELVEIIRGISNFDWIISEPFDVGKNGVNVFLLLRLRIRVVEPHDRLASDPHALGDLGLPKVKVHRLGVTDVKVSVGLRGKAGEVLPSCGLEVLIKNLL
mmetsp:Transcript_9223/g.30787  ORF Transcript_9223/g.30787 Transcript_9223/m.30787 type:complete len:201 (-) Transcript_9223:560-1162(-)